MSELITKTEAIARLQAYREQKTRVLGADGFYVTDKGYVASLDLIIDTSLADVSIEDSICLVENFILEKGTDGVLFELCVDN
jgi:hypothetical protein